MRALTSERYRDRDRDRDREREMEMDRDGEREREKGREWERVKQSGKFEVLNRWTYKQTGATGFSEALVCRPT